MLEFVDVTRRVALELQKLGYFGPLGIDAMIYLASGGRVCVRPLQDVNARWTMGRLAAEWDREPNTGRFAFFRLTSDSTALERQGPSCALPVSPTRLGEAPLHHRFWLELQAGIDGSNPAPGQ